jgi:hypothetical protein
MITERSQPASARTLYPPSNIAAALGGVRAETFNLYAKTERLLRQMCSSDFHGMTLLEFLQETPGSLRTSSITRESEKVRALMEMHVADMPDLPGTERYCRS